MEGDQKKLKQELLELTDSGHDCDKRMGKLKASLYAKFGNNINLDV